MGVVLRLLEGGWRSVWLDSHLHARGRLGYLGDTLEHTVSSSWRPLGRVGPWDGLRGKDGGGASGAELRLRNGHMSNGVALGGSHGPP